jgi:hypothetical protein
VDEAAKQLIDVVKLVLPWPLVRQLYALLVEIMLGNAKVLAKRLIKDERGYFGLSFDKRSAEGGDLISHDEIA